MNRTNTIEDLLVQLCVELGVTGLLPSQVGVEPMSMLNSEAWDDIERITAAWPQPGTSEEERLRIAQTLLIESNTPELRNCEPSRLVHQLRHMENWS